MGDLLQLRFTPQDIVDLVYDTLECLDRVLKDAQIPYTIFGGTALGAERHTGLIPWDDDADIAILSDDEQRLLDLKETFRQLGYTLQTEEFFGYRLFHSTGAKPRPLDQYPYPFVDIFLIKDTGCTYEYVTEGARRYWPQKPLPYGCFNRLIDVPFGHLILRGMNGEDTRDHLDENYGKDWPFIAWREFDHFFYENVTDSRVALKEEKARRPARHSNYPRLIQPLKSVLNQKTSL